MGERRTRQTVSIHAFRGEGDQASVYIYDTLAVSIHAFRGEGDLVGFIRRANNTVSIHAFRGEGDQSIWASSRRI